MEKHFPHQKRMQQYRVSPLHLHVQDDAHLRVTRRYTHASSMPRSAPISPSTPAITSNAIQVWLRWEKYGVWLASNTPQRNTSRNAPQNISIPAIALLRTRVGKLILPESQTAIIAPGVGAPIRATQSTLNKLSRGVLAGKRRTGVVRAKIRIMVSGNNPVNAPTIAGRQRTGATSICSPAASTRASWRMAYRLLSNSTRYARKGCVSSVLTPKLMKEPASTEAMMAAIKLRRAKLRILRWCVTPVNPMAASVSRLMPEPSST